MSRSDHLNSRILSCFLSEKLKLIWPLRYLILYLIFYKYFSVFIPWRNLPICSICYCYLYFGSKKYFTNHSNLPDLLTRGQCLRCSGTSSSSCWWLCWAGDSSSSCCTPWRTSSCSYRPWPPTHHHPLLQVHSIHHTTYRRRINTEEKAKIIAALAILHDFVLCYRQLT